MKRNLLSFAMAGILMTATYVLHAQQNKPNIRLGVTVEGGIPVGHFSDASNFAAAGSIVAQYAIAEKLAVLASAGFTNYFGKNHKFTEYDDNGDQQELSIKAKDMHGIPLRAGASFLLTENIFVQGTAGVSFLSDGNGTAFIYAPAVGYQLRHLEASVKYEGLSKNGTLGYVGLQVGYFFN